MRPTLAYNLLQAVGAPAFYQRVQRPAGAVLMCHSVGSPHVHAFDPNSEWRITATLLEQVLRCAHAMGFEAVTMDTVAERLRGDASEAPFYALTFDDGYADNLHVALPVCQRNHVPMTTYVTSGFVRRTHVAWWHAIEKLIAGNATIRVRLAGELVSFDCQSVAAKQAAFDRLAQWLTLARVPERTDFMEDVRDRYGNGPSEYAESLFMTEAELREFSRSAYACVGVHGESHCAFSSLEPDELDEELDASTRYLAALGNVEPRHLAYPYGSPATTTQRDFDIAQRQGFITGVTTRHGCLSSTEDRWLALPRIPVFPSDTESSMRCKLSGLTTLLARWRKP